MIIDSSYFVGEINIPGRQNPDIVGNLNLFIEKYEPMYLKQAMGYSLYIAFMDGLAAPVLEQRWQELLDGVDYTSESGCLEHWQGLATSDSPIAMYIWYWWDRDSITMTTTMGEKKGSTENSVDMSAMQKQVRTYNEMSAITCQLHEYLNARADVYPEFKAQQTEPFGKLNIFNL